MRKVILHIVNKVKDELWDLSRECFNSVKTKERKYFYKTEQGNYYRAFNFISDAKTYMKVENKKYMYETGKVVCLIELDIVILGLSLYDIGDFIKSGCSSANEDETDVSKLTIDMNLYNNFVKSLLKENKTTLNKYEIENTLFSVKLIVIKLAVRFLIDYINGYTYFKGSTERPSHNIERTRNQLKLVGDRERNLICI